MAVYPNAIPTTTDLPDAAGPNLSSQPHSTHLHNKPRDETIAIAAELGVAPSGSYSTVASRLNAGWQPITSGAPAAVASFSVAIPASTYELVRVHILGGFIASGIEAFACRVNNDATAGLHQWHINDMTAVPVLGGSVNTSAASWRLGWVTSTGFMECEFKIHTTTAGGSYSSFCPYQAVTSNFNATAASALTAIAGGRLSAVRTLSSLTFFPAASTFTGRYIVEGYKVP